jgi:hypothetical protein
MYMYNHEERRNLNERGSLVLNSVSPGAMSSRHGRVWLIECIQCLSSSIVIASSSNWGIMSGMIYKGTSIYKV